MGHIIRIIVILFIAFIAFIVWGAILSSRPEQRALRDAEDAVSAQLRDAGSAEFRNIRVYRDTGSTLTVCGEVNGRNGFGGMAGFSRFWYVGGGIPIIEEARGNSTFDALWANQGCDGSKGEPVLTR